MGPGRDVEKETYLRNVWGDKVIDKLLNWSFELACEEANYLRLKEECTGELHYLVSFNTLNKFRREATLYDLFDYSIVLEDRLKIPMSSFKEI